MSVCEEQLTFQLTLHVIHIAPNFNWLSGFHFIIIFFLIRYFLGHLRLHFRFVLIILISFTNFQAGHACTICPVL